MKVQFEVKGIQSFCDLPLNRLTGYGEFKTLACGTNEQVYVLLANKQLLRLGNGEMLHNCIVVELKSPRRIVLEECAFHKAESDLPLSDDKLGILGETVRFYRYGDGATFLRVVSDSETDVCPRDAGLCVNPV